MTASPPTLNLLGPLVETLIQELARRWSQSERPRTEEFLARHPELRMEPAAAIDLLYEEICLAEQAGESHIWESVLLRFPQWQEQLQALFDCHRLLQPAQPEPSFPACGDVIGEYRLLKELGRGARGRVFLAAQAALGNRPVVLKLTPREGREHLSLARLQHTNIVPLYAARDDRERQLRLLCMPYLGSATLSELLAGLASIPFAQRMGQDLVAVLDRLQAETPVPLAPGIGPKKFLARASYVEAICWIGACCADALHYAHERGLVHLDLKPSNVLVAADGQPMLLDFHLAHEPLRAGQPAPDEFGGTSAYMPPEQRTAIEAVGEGKPVPTTVGPRADLYSLGAVLYEALGGSIPFDPATSPPLHSIHPQASVGLSDILAKCLAAEPGQRYPDAAALALDLRCHLTHQPLRGTANRSLRERWRKFRQRRPSALYRMTVTLFLLGMAMALVVGPWLYVSERFHQAERALEVGQDQWHKHKAYSEALASFRYGLERVDGLPFSADLAGQLREQARLADEAQARAAREQLVRDLHGQVEFLSLVLGLERVPTSQLRGLEAQARDLWEKRLPIRERLGDNFDEAAQQDFVELAIALSDLTVRLGGDQRAARRRALDLFDEAEALLGRRTALDYERRALGIEPVDASDLPPPRTAWEHRLLGRSLLRAGQLDRAWEELLQSRDQEPSHPWANYFYGQAAYRLRRYEEAALAFSVCIGAEPRRAEYFYSRGLALAGLGRIVSAIRDYDQALRLDSKLANAALNRGMLHYQEKRYDRGLDDLETALRLGADPALVYYDRALIQVASRDHAAALRCLERALQFDPRHAEALRLREQLRAQR
jgi:serine/threonine protein kinase/Flp pilus assembly protein TadD